MPYGGGVQMERPDEYIQWNVPSLRSVPIEKWTESMVLNCNALVIIPPIDSEEPLSECHESGFDIFELIFIVDDRRGQKLYRLVTRCDVVQIETDVSIDLLPGTGWTRILGNSRIRVEFQGSVVRVLEERRSNAAI